MELYSALLILIFCVSAMAKIICSKRSRQWFQNRRPSTIFYTKLEAVSPTPTSEKQILLKDTPPYVFPSLRLKAPSSTSMGLKRLEADNWLTIDSQYYNEHTIRNSLLTTRHAQVVQCLPGSEQACHEVLELVTAFMSQRFPDDFTVAQTSCGPVIRNHITNESFQIGPYCPNPLEVAARLAMEDFNVLIKHPETGRYHLMASATLFPAGWKLQERIGTSIENLHKPVPEWKKNLGGSVNRYFDHLNSRTAMERYNLFIQSSPHLFVDSPEVPRPGLVPEDMNVRRERQTFSRLEKSNAVLFTVRTYIVPLVDVKGDEEMALRQQVGSWEGISRTYKGSEVWGEPFAAWEKRVDAARQKVSDGEKGEKV